VEISGDYKESSLKTLFPAGRVVTTDFSMFWVCVWND